MGSINKDMERRVWQRVQGVCSDPAVPTPAEAPAQTGPEGLLLDELTDGAVLRRLSGKAKEPEAALLRQLMKHTATRAGVLRGICLLSGVPCPTMTPAPTEEERRELLLRRLMGRLLRRDREYRKLCDHPEFGTLYEGLSQNARDAALLLAHAMGK